MEQIALHDKRGMTLLEIMISLVIMAIVAVALMQSSIIVINNNIKNELRDEAVNVAEQRMNELRNELFTDPDLIAGVVTQASITRNLRGALNFPFTPIKTITDINTNTKQVDLTITWTYRNTQYKHSVSTVLRRK